jgi:hypothetical protein
MFFEHGRDPLAQSNRFLHFFPWKVEGELRRAKPPPETTDVYLTAATHPHEWS